MSIAERTGSPVSHTLCASYLNNHAECRAIAIYTSSFESLVHTTIPVLSCTVNSQKALGFFFFNPLNVRIFYYL